MTPELEDLVAGLEGEQREARLRLLRRLADDGCSTEDLRRAVDEDRLVLLAVERALGGEPLLTMREVAEQAGLPLEAVQRARRALGLPLPDPDERTLHREDADAAQRIAGMLALGLPLEGVLDANRVVGRATAQMAAAMRVLIADAVLEPGASEERLAERLTEVARVLLPSVGPTLQWLFTLHLRELLRTDVLGAEQRAAGTVAGQTTAVAFADLVGFTRLGGRIPAEELGGVARQLDLLVSEALRPPVRLVKTIGDAAMLVSREPEPLVATLLDLVAAADARGEGFPQLRAGAALGETVEREGDVYGHPVNVASRITDLARPGSVLVTAEIGEALPSDGFRTSFAGARSLRNVRGSVPLVRVRPAERR